MKKNTLVYIIIIVILSLLFFSYIREETGEGISIKSVSSIEIVIDDEEAIVYNSSENNKEIKEFIKALNEGKPWGTIEGITPNTQFTIIFKDGTAMTSMQ